MPFTFDCGAKFNFCDWFRRTVVVTLFVLLGVGSVLLVALVISIIQFQIRVIEAKNQSKNFSLTSLTQSVAMQKEFVESVKFVQKSESVISEYETSNGSYSSGLFQFVSMLCAKFEKLADRTNCIAGIANALQSGAPSSSYVYYVISRYGGFPDDQLPPAIKALADVAANLAVDRHKAATGDYGKMITMIRTKCGIIERYVSLSSDAPNQAGGLGQTQFVGQQPDKGGFIQSFAREYVITAQQRCLFNFHVGAQAVVTPIFTPPAEPTGAAAKAASQSNDSSTQESKKIEGTGGSVNPTPTPKASGAKLEADLSSALFFDLVSYYSFYEGVIGGGLTELAVIAPIDISFILLVILCGALGAMVRITAQFYDPSLFSKQRETSRGNALYSFVLGIMCALIVYILAKTAYAGLSEATYTAKSGNLSPFVTAFLAIISGLLCEEAFQQIIVAGRAVLARSTGNRASTNRGRTRAGSNS